MAPTRILVTGGCGFLGSEIVRSLISTNDYDITAVDINPPSLGTSSFAQVRYVRANVLDPEELQKVFNQAKPVVVVHTVGVYHVGAARYGEKGQETVFEINVTGTRNVIEAATSCEAKALVFTSSVTVLLDQMWEDFLNADETWPTGRATTAYGQSKTAAEDLVLAANKTDFATCSLRSAPIFGPNDPACMSIFHRCIERGETPFIIGSGTNLCDFVYVSNVADAHVLAVRNLLKSGTAAGEAFFITNGEPITARDFCIAIWKEFGHVPSFQVRIPKALAWWLGLGAEWASWATGTQGSLSRGVVWDATATRYVSIAKARRVLGYDPRVSLPEALKISCKHFQRQLDGRSKS
ncbi:C-3 sterol dehydrogenase/C-4 decarboxylase-like protein [Pleomassaria siparia CBS 279.74]|uniref:C-3 sterol dehydrogenase/C-4 decarboxylase-like protein n=1 Tax=Pleomassaria siparia CBS 279.74 TaxID=1314801 RepID=A0A6G1KD47_9PLEO|nr:C-3 sterol dehydrogenase/C-4 decarboxylase-like protein [Pleomassaria siparia CBS 279.74]